MFCRNCGAQTDDAAQFCIKCGASLQEMPETAGAPPEVPYNAPPELPYNVPPPVTEAPPPPGATPYSAPPPQGAWVPPGTIEPKSKLVAGLLGIFLGAFGVHRLYLGYNTIGIIQLVLGLSGMFTCGITTIVSFIWGLIDGIMILTGSIPTDANGVPLRD